MTLRYSSNGAWRTLDQIGQVQLGDEGVPYLPLEANDVPNTATLSRINTGVVAITAAGLDGMLETT